MFLSGAGQRVPSPSSLKVQGSFVSSFLTHRIQDFKNHGFRDGRDLRGCRVYLLHFIDKKLRQRLSVM